jgi:hypothetical protein
MPLPINLLCDALQTSVVISLIVKSATSTGTRPLERDTAGNTPSPALRPCDEWYNFFLSVRVRWRPLRARSATFPSSPFQSATTMPLAFSNSTFPVTYDDDQLARIHH